MNLIKPKFEILEQQSGIDGIYKMIELAGRTCYRSEDKITEDSAKAFVDRMIKSGHGAMLEHGTVYLTIPITDSTSYRIDSYIRNKYTRSAISKNLRDYYITTNLRVLVENNWLNDLQYICEPTEFHEKRVTVRFICDRGVSHEFVRHRVFSFAQESTRYCNYSKNKFSNELTYITPLWLDYSDVNIINLSPVDVSKLSDIGYTFFNTLWESEQAYISLLNNGWKPQQARAVLPNALKTELVMTGFVSDWEHFFELRCAPSAHPQAQELAIPLREEFIKRKYLSE